MKTRFTDETGIEIRRKSNNTWQHFDISDGRAAQVGPVYQTKAEALTDHEAYLVRGGWMKPCDERVVVVTLIWLNRVNDMMTIAIPLLAASAPCAREDLAYQALNQWRDRLEAQGGYIANERYFFASAVWPDGHHEGGCFELERGRPQSPTFETEN